jgi:hypothetical protein
MCTKNNVCNKVIKTFINNFGVEEIQYCVNEGGHKGKCSYRPNYKLFGAYETKIKNKLYNAALSTAGETAKNSPILNRALRWVGKPITGLEERKLKSEGIYRVGIRKDEASYFKNCSEVEIKLYEVVKKVYDGISDETTKCYYCNEDFNFDDFLLGSKNPNSVQICHLNPLNEDKVMHNVDNCFWGHRQCNIIQGDQPIFDMFQRIQKICNNLKSKLQNSTE